MEISKESLTAEKKRRRRKRETREREKRERERKRVTDIEKTWTIFIHVFWTFRG